MATYVLVHGAWHGSWCWKRVRKALQAAGHEVFTPTLSGLGERSHLNSPSINLDTHIADVENLIRWEELSDIVLCGHSYGGCVVSGAADRLPERIRALIYLDGFVPEDGECVDDLVPKELVQAVLHQVETTGEGWKVAPISAEAFNVNPRDRAWMNAQCTPQSRACFQQPIKLTGGIGRVRNVAHILATGWDNTLFPVSHERAKAKGWKTLTMNCGHDVMLDLPDELAGFLLQFV